MLRTKRIKNKFALLSYQKRLIEKHYTFLKCEIDWRRTVLVCTGWVKVNEDIEPYKVKIEYVVGKEPKTTILKPFVHPCKEIHMYNDNSLCLHYSPDLVWDERIRIYEYTIPWISEWIVYYEIYKVNGNKWEGRESPVHMRETDRNVNTDSE